MEAPGKDLLEFGAGVVMNPSFGLAYVETLLCVVVAMIVLRLELQRRAGAGPDIGSRRETVGRYAASARKLLKECAPEAAGLMACLTLAAALRARGTEKVLPEEREAWENIKAQWPLLMTADTLLSLQVMLRLVVLLSVVLRAGSGGPVPLSEESSVLWFGANLARLALVCRSAVYMLDGPLGGFLPVACEVAVLPILLVLSRGTFKRAWLALSMIAMCAICFASRHNLSLAGDVTIDGLFTLAHALDFLAAVVYLVRTVLIDRTSRDVSVSFTHMIMPIQQGFAAYYFLQAFAAVPELVGSGLPFEFLQISSMVAFGAYLSAAILHFAECYDARMQSV